MNKSVTKKIGSKTYLQTYVDKNELAVGCYTIVPADMTSPTHLEDFQDFTLPTRLYGEPLSYLTDKVMKSFATLNKSVGVLLSGLKGTGKSLQLKHLAMNSNMPVLIVNQMIDGPELTKFLETVPTSCVVVFDEFEKVYKDTEDQESILPLLDGIGTNPHIFVLTVNGAVSEFLISRPSRIRYKRTYSSLENALIKEIVFDLLNDKSKTEEVSDMLSMMTDVNMDMVVAFVQDVNLFPEESVDKIIKTFNLEDPMMGNFTVVFATPGLALPQEKTSEVKAKVIKYLKDNFGFSKLNPLDQFANKEILNRNLAIMQQVVNEFPAEVSIRNYTAKAETSDIVEFLSELSNDSPYLSKYYGGQEYLTEDQMFEHIHNSYIANLGNITIKKLKNNTIEIYSNEQLIAVAIKDKGFRY
jgi:hypothetical protein